MRYVVDHDFHIHSQLSECSSHPEQTNENILKYAKDNGLKKICLTDHFWDEKVGRPSPWYEPQNFPHICKALPLPTDDSVEFMFGCESDFDKEFRVGVSPERYDEFKFIIIPTTHLHMPGFTIENRQYSMEERADLWVKRLEKLLDMDLPWHKIGIAHLACPLLAWSTKEDYLYALSLISSEDMYRLFKKAAKLGVGIEINAYDMKFEESETDAILRMFRIAKECGCKFYLGSDSHNPKGFEHSVELFNKAVNLLGLTEEDKFHIGK